MAKPRIFISSTYFDLKHIRKNLELFVHQMGYEPVLFESGDIPFEHTLPLDISCYQEIANCHIQILIIGGRYGASSSSQHTGEPEHPISMEHFKFYNSITRMEYTKARELGIPIFIFVQKGVHAEYETYKKNRENEAIVYAHVDNVNIFRLIDDIYSEKVGNYIKEFDSFDDIQNWLRDQWAGIFANFLSQKTTNQQISNLAEQVSQLSILVNSLSEYSEAIIRQLKPENFEELIENQKNAVESGRIRVPPSYSELLNQANIEKAKFLYQLRRSSTLEEFITRLTEMYDQPILFKSQAFSSLCNYLRKEMSLPTFDPNFDGTLMRIDGWGIESSGKISSILISDDSTPPV